MVNANNFGWAAVVYLAGLAVLYKGKFERNPNVGDFLAAGIRSSIARRQYGTQLARQSLARGGSAFGSGFGGRGYSTGIAPGHSRA